MGFSVSWIKLIKLIVFWLFGQKESFEERQFRVQQSFCKMENQLLFRFSFFDGKFRFAFSIFYVSLQFLNMGKTRPLSVYFCSFHNSIANIHDVNGKNVDVVLGIWTPGQPLTPTSTHCAKVTLFLKVPMTVCDDFQSFGIGNCYSVDCNTTT